MTLNSLLKQTATFHEHLFPNIKTRFLSLKSWINEKAAYNRCPIRKERKQGAQKGAQLDTKYQLHRVCIIACTYKTVTTDVGHNRLINYAFNKVSKHVSLVMLRVSTH